MNALLLTMLCKKKGYKMLGVAISGNAQSYVTYNHDSSKKNQITVMEIGSGSLSPELYYQLLHSSYKKSTASKNKLGFRTTVGIGAYNQVEYAEAIDSALTERAEIEALNMADRQIDLAWLAEGSKITSQMEKFQKNIDRILLVGGTPTDKERWTEYYHVFDCAVNATKKAFMPNAQRKQEYLRIYADVTKHNEILVKYLARLHSKSQTDNLLTATYERNTNKTSIISSAKERWNTAKQSSQPTKREDNSGSSDGGDDDGESVNR